MDVFSVIEQSLSARIAELEVLNDRLRKNRRILSKALIEKEKVLSSTVKVGSLPAERLPYPVDGSGDDSKSLISASEETLESKLDQILAIAKTTRVAPPKAQSNPKDMDQKKLTNNSAAKGSSRKPLAAYVSSSSSVKKPDQPSSRTIPQKNPSNHPSISDDKQSSRHTTCPEHFENSSMPSADAVSHWESNVTEQLAFFNRNRVFNKYKTQFYPNTKLTQAQSSICFKVEGTISTIATSNMFFDFMMYTFGTSLLEQLMRKLNNMQRKNLNFEEVILSLVYSEGRSTVQKLSKQSLLVKTSLGLDDAALLECWMMGRLLITLVTFVLRQEATPNLSCSILGNDWVQLNNSLKVSFGRVDDVFTKITTQHLLTSLYQNRRNIIKHMVKLCNRETLMRLQLFIKDVINKYDQKVSVKVWEPVLKCVRVLLAITLHDGKKINCSILHKALN